MARIRSLHPGFWTDEIVMTLSVENPLAICVLQGLWNEADDQGLFEWKPIVIKAKVLPAAPADVAAIMGRLEELGAIKGYVVSGKRYGAVRNFAKYQRPQKPKDVHPFPDELREWTGLKAKKTSNDTVPIPDEDDTDPGIPPQMDDEGGRRDDERGGVLRTQDARARNFDAVWKAYPHPGNASRALAQQAWDALGDDLPPIASLLVAVDLYRGWLNTETKRRPVNDPPPAMHLANWLKERRFDGFMEGSSEVDRLAADAASRREELPSSWREAGDRFAAEHGWKAWEAAISGARLVDGDPPGIEFARAVALNLARDHGVLKRLAKALGQDPMVTVRGGKAA